MKKIERRLFLRGLGAGVAVGFAELIQQALAAEPKSLRQGVNTISGEVSVNGKPAHEGTAIARGDSVSTAAGAHAVFVIADNAFLLRANSRVDIGESSVATFMRVVTGGLLSVFGKGNKVITTPTATIGIRGTGCYIETDARKSYFCLCYGAVELRPLNGQAVRYTTTHHEKPLWIENGVMKRAAVVNHTDAEVIMLDALVGRGSPFPAGMDRY
jgi:hypothetical protein